MTGRTLAMIDRDIQDALSVSDHAAVARLRREREQLRRAETAAAEKGGDRDA